MRVFSLFLAAVATVLLYALVFERPRLAAALGGDLAAAFAPLVPPWAAAPPAPQDDPIAPAAPTAAAAPTEAPAAAAPGAAGDAAADSAPGLAAVSPPGTSSGPAPFAVVARHSVARPIDTAVVLRGRTEAARAVEVRAETSGLVVSEPLRKGAVVAAGDVLCELDPGVRTAQLAEARARLAEAQARLPEAEARVPAAEAARGEAIARLAEAEARLTEARARLSEAEINAAAALRLSEGGFASETRVANAQAALESARAGVTSAEAALRGAQSLIVSADAGVAGARAAVEGAQAQIESAQAAVASAEREIARLTIRAPFAGLLETDAAELGSLMQPGSLCATVIQLDPVKLVGFVPEADIGKLAVGAPAVARLTSGLEVRGEVGFLSRSADESTRTFRLEVVVPNPDFLIRDGETAEIRVSAAGTEAHLVPQSSLTLDDEGRLGLRTVAEGNIVAFAPVTFLRDTPEGVWVAGLPPEVDIIVVGQDYVTDGVAVAPVFQEGADG